VRPVGRSLDVVLKYLKLLRDAFDIRRYKKGGHLHLRRPLSVSQEFYGSAVIVNREAGTLDFRS